MVLYVPVVLIAYRYPRYGILSAFLAGAAYLALYHIFIPGWTDFPEVLVNTVLLVGIGSLTAILSYRLSEKKINLRGIYDASSAGIFLLSKDGSITEENDRFLSMLGYGGGERPEHLDRIWLRTGADRFPDGANNGIETEFITRDDRQIPVLLSTAPGPDDLTVCTVVDIGPQKQAEREREEERARTREYLDVAGVILLILDDRMHVRAINRKGCTILGYPEDEIVGQDWAENYLPVRVRDSVVSVCTSVLQSDRGTVVPFENPVLTRDGEERQIAWTIQPIRDEKGEVFSILASGEDITRHRQTVRALEESEERYESLVAIAPEAIGIYCDGQIVYLNAAALRMLGIKGPVDFEQMPFWPFIHPDSLATVREELTKTQTGVWSSYFQEIKLCRVDGETAYAESTMVPITYKGRPATQFVLRDITIQKRMEEELRRSEVLYRTIFEAAAAAMVIVEEDLTISRANSGFLTLSGLPGDEIEGKIPWGLFYSPQDGKRMLEYHRKRCNGDPTAPQTYLSSFVDGGGDFHDVIVTASIIPETKKSIVSFVDVTVQREYEKELQRSLLEKEALLKEIHHRVKNNMQQIASLLSLQAATVADRGTAGCLQASENRITAMALVHENLYQSESLASIRADAYITTLCSEIRASYTPGPGIRVETAIDDLVLDTDTAIPCGLIINELVTNAFKHAFTGRDRGRVLVSLGQHAGGRLCLRVEDDGIGLPANISIDNEETLGVRLVSALSDQIGGTPRFESDSGTRFSVTFPYTPSQSPCTGTDSTAEKDP
ncbi:PAS domain-containing sensor histidine kinase [Methanofollis ethanolicus]|uniref:PAS domain-containing sensor histidine kinase n=1 Tax=Methanofollis ethanolicus TaxID=488124 RepID=UPI0013664DF5|nr:PAS domain S-box protein [Methanofollis ethanolicus]